MPLEERLHPDSSDDAELAFHWHRYQAAAAQLAGRDVLDVGSGEGYGAAVLARTARSVAAVDVDAPSIERARGRYPDDSLKFFAASAAALPFADASFDAVVAFELLEHLPRSDHAAALSEWKRVLRPGGVVLVSTPDRERMREFPANPFHVGELSAPELEQLLAQHFAHAQVYFQELSAGSVIWNPQSKRAGGTPMTGFGLAWGEAGALPAPVGHTTHLSLVAVAADSAPAAAAIALEGFLAESERRLLSRLWARVDQLAAASAAAERAAAWATEESQALWQQNRLLADEALAASKQVAALQEELARLEGERGDWQREHEELGRVSARLAIIEASRGWRLVSRYWRVLDEGRGVAPALKLARRVVLGRRRTSVPPPGGPPKPGESS